MAPAQNSGIPQNFGWRRLINRVCGGAIARLRVAPPEFACRLGSRTPTLQSYLVVVRPVGATPDQFWLLVPSR
jgi:hypothetical protein